MFYNYKDTLLFLLAPLSALPKTFGLNVQDKGYFPHLFTCHANLELQMRYTPHKRFYGPEWMKQGDRDRFEQWHQQQRVIDQQTHPTGAIRFNLRQKLVEYCSNDVKILIYFSNIQL